MGARNLIGRASGRRRAASLFAFGLRAMRAFCATLAWADFCKLELAQAAGSPATPTSLGRATLCDGAGGDGGCGVGLGSVAAAAGSYGCSWLAAGWLSGLCKWHRRRHKRQGGSSI